MVCILCNKETNNRFQVVGGAVGICVDCELKRRDKSDKSGKEFFRFLQGQFDCNKNYIYSIDADKK